MPIELHTGMPGAGKSLKSVSLIFEKYLPQGRKVYADIMGLDYDGMGVNRLCSPELDDEHIFHPQKIEQLRNWMETVEDGSIVIIDEAQRCFPSRNGASKTPDYISAFETHRHRGLDFILITQGPGFIDRHFHALVNKHVHLTRPLNLNHSVQLEWSTVNPDPEPSANKSNTLRKKFKFPKKYFSAYSSSVDHNMKVDIPWRLLAFTASTIIGATFFIFYTYTQFNSIGPDQPSGPQAVQTEAPQQAPKACTHRLVARSGNDFLLSTSNMVNGLLERVSASLLIAESEHLRRFTVEGDETKLICAG